MSADDVLLKEWIRIFLVGVVLIAYVMVFVPEVVQAWRKQTTPPNEARTYIWTTLGAVIGGVTAVYLGVTLPAKLTSFAPWGPPSIETMRGVYSLVYVASGLAALVTWYARTEFASTLLKNAATTFGGLAVAVVSALLLPPGT